MLRITVLLSNGPQCRIQSTESTVCLIVDLDSLIFGKHNIIMLSHSLSTGRFHILVDSSAHSSDEGGTNRSRFMSGSAMNWTAKDVGLELQPERMSRTPSGGDYHRGRRPQLLHQLEALPKRIHHAFHDCPDQMRTVVSQCQAHPGGFRLRVHVWSPLAGQMRKVEQSLRARRD